MSTLRAVVGLVQVPRSRISLAVGLGAATVMFGVGLMATAGYLISRAAERPAILSLMVAIVAVRCFGLGRPVLRYAERLVSHDVALRGLISVRERVYRRIEPLAPAQLGYYRSGDLLSRMVADVDGLQNLYLRGLQPPLVALVAGALSVGVAAAFAPLAGVVLAVGLLSCAIVLPALTAVVARRARSSQAAARGALGAAVIEVMDCSPEIVAFGQEQERLAELGRADRELVRLARRDALASGAAEGVGLLLTGATVAGVLAVAVSASAAGHLDRVMIAMLGLLALASFEAVTPLGSVARELSATLAAGRRVLELTDRQATIVDPPQPAAPPHWPFAVEFDDVRARYPGEPRPALDAFSLRLEPGEHVAIVGASGAGKTTAVNLLLRFLDPERGTVTLGGRDLRAYRQADIRSATSVAGQDSHLFSVSIRQNVALARPGATDEEIERALRRAAIWDWVSQLPEGLDTLVGEQGRELSGGQRQRIVLARAFMTDAHVLVLDEPTAHLDPETAQVLMEDVMRQTEGMTVVLITHRDEGLDLVDRVVALEPAGLEPAGRS
jgi:ATP-binding cassette subfamily C protein CydC